MGAMLPPAPLIPFIQLIIPAHIPLIPLFWIVVIVIWAKTCAFRQKPIQIATRDAVFQILGVVLLPIVVSIVLWILFYAQIIYAYYYVVFYFILEPLRKSLSRQWLLSPETQAVYPLMWYDNAYQYHALKRVHEIRLLVLYPAGSLDDPLRGDIIGADLRRMPTYDALSYTWADEDGDTHRSRAVHCVRNDSKICVTKNCDAALRRLRLPDKERRLWVDAICINQDSDAERSYQVSLMSKIYMNSRHVIAYTGEGTLRTDLLYDWLNDVDVADLNVPSAGMFRDIDVGNSILNRLVYIWNAPGGAKDWANEIAIVFERYWRIYSERLSMAFRGRFRYQKKIAIPEKELGELVTEYFSRRWFKRVWVLQEVSLPELRKTRVMCGSKITTAERALHLVSLLKTQGSGSMVWVFILLRRRISGLKTSHLLDILVETRHRECGDPRDKIFGVLSIARWMDDEKFPQLKADYGNTTEAVYWNFSAFFIQHHGAGFFLSLIKSRRRLQHLPSWAGDWTVPWPNYNAVRGIDFAGRSRMANKIDGGGYVKVEDGKPVLSLPRPRILRGFITRDGHIDDSRDTHIEDIGLLDKDEVLIEMYPGLAALLKKDGDYHVFVQVCPHALSESGVEDLVGRWSRVVVYMEGPGTQTLEAETMEYLASPEIFKIW